MVTVAILAILAAIAAPSFTPILERWRMRQIAEDLQASIYFARSEALKRSGNITLSANDGDWSKGWQVLADSTVLQDNAAPNQTTITFSNTATSLFFDRWGMISTTSGGAPSDMDFHFETGGSGTAARLCIQAGGRSLVHKNGEACPS